MTVNMVEVPKAVLPGVLQRIYEQRGWPCKVLFVEPAPNIRYGDVVETVDVAKAPGVAPVVMLTGNEWATMKR